MEKPQISRKSRLDWQHHVLVGIIFKLKAQTATEDKTRYQEQLSIQIKCKPERPFPLIYINKL